MGWSLLRAAAVTVTLLAVILGGMEDGETKSQMGQGIQPPAAGFPAQGSGGIVQTEGRATYGEGNFAGRHSFSGSLPGRRIGKLAAESRKVPASLGSREANKPLEPGRLENKPDAAGRSEGRGADNADGRSLPGAYSGVDYRGTFTVTAYTAGYESTQKKKGQPGYGITASGTTVAEGRTIAADWDVLPPGTRVYIEGVGERTVEDRGGAVDGKHVDLYMDELADALEWGKQKKQLYVIEWGKRDE